MLLFAGGLQAARRAVKWPNFVPNVSNSPKKFAHSPDFLVEKAMMVFWAKSMDGDDVDRRCTPFNGPIVHQYSSPIGFVANGRLPGESGASLAVCRVLHAKDIQSD